MSLDVVRVAIGLVEGGGIDGFENCTLGIGTPNLGTLGTDEACSRVALVDGVRSEPVADLSNVTFLDVFGDKSLKLVVFS